MFQKIADWIQSIKTPTWLKTLLAEVQKILIAALIGIAKAYITKLEDKIIEVANSSMSNKDKFNVVFKYGKAEFPDIKDSILNTLIECLVLILKEKGFAKITS